ncbi:MAG: GntR family transcriptional regulator [Chloroflexi bacterium]|nr:GntR family transcriptional regulator [Chloroflexota bacterium]
MQEGLIVETPDGKLHVVSLTPQYVLDTYLVRSALEGLAAELAAPRIADTTLVALRQLLADIPAALAHGQVEAHTRAEALHRTIYEASANVVLVRELHALQSHVDLIRGYSQRHMGEHLRLAHAEHVRIVDALAGRDPAAARQAMERHIRDSADRVAQLINFQEARALSATTC